jgi:hypothetical protein
MTVRSYTVTAPLDDYWWQNVSCQTVGCQNRAKGWTCNIDETLYDGQRAAHFFRKIAGLRYTEAPHATAADVTVFTFEAGQPCFRDGRAVRAHRTLNVAPHRVRRRQELFLVQRSERGYGNKIVSTTERAHTRGADWVEDMALHVDRITPALNNR